ncbi:MAG: ABC transporter substrate-binding protein [Thermoplasmata archaeon]|nr:ABC transporter substrate-binding protein [Thermoplasmata archaeon]MCI4344210.1 ABC transporter substrate-binding protein [Thermoplasmata archaeon]
MSLNTTSNSPPRSGRQVSLALVAVLVLVVAGAAIGATAAYFELKPTPGTSSPNHVTVTDDLGRTVMAPWNPTRVVALSPSIVDSMVRLGLRDHLVGVDCSSPAFGGLSADYDASQTAAWHLSSAMCVQTAPLDSEAMVNLSPELVLASTIVSISAVQEITSTLHIPVLMLQPVSVTSIVTDVQLLMSLFPTGTAGPSLVTAMERELGNVSTLDANLSANDALLPSVLLTYAVNPSGSTAPGYWTFGPSTFGQSLVELAGGSSISANVTIPWPELSGEQVLLANPSLIVYGTGFGLDLAQYAQGPDWSSLVAVQSSHDYAIDSTLITEPGPTTVLVGLPALIGILHPS